MGHASQPQPVKLVLPMLTREPAHFNTACERLFFTYGRIDYTSAILSFNHTTYYEQEFGSGLQRQFVAFERLVDPGELTQVKLMTNLIEQSLAVAGRRIINLDPGYLSLAKFVLATTKDQSHRIYVGQGIYAEITLCYQHREWCVCPWTYPDYRTVAYLQVISELRAIYVSQLKEQTESR